MNNLYILITDLNLLDWSANNHLAVALGSSIYLWNASSGDITQLFQFDNHEEYVGAVAWVKEGNYLAVGSSTGDVQVSVYIYLREREVEGSIPSVGGSGVGSDMAGW